MKSPPQQLICLMAISSFTGYCTKCEGILNRIHRKDPYPFGNRIIHFRHGSAADLNPDGIVPDFDAGDFPGGDFLYDFKRIQIKRGDSCPVGQERGEIKQMILDDFKIGRGQFQNLEVDISARETGRFQDEGKGYADRHHLHPAGNPHRIPGTLNAEFGKIPDRPLLQQPLDHGSMDRDKHRIFSGFIKKTIHAVQLPPDRMFPRRNGNPNHLK
jgi:hypothetical protein